MFFQSFDTHSSKFFNSIRMIFQTLQLQSTILVLNRCSASFLQVFREIMKAESFFFIIIMTLEEFCNIFQNIKFIILINLFNNISPKIYLFLHGTVLFVFWIINFGVPQIFHIIKSVP